MEIKRSELISISRDISVSAVVMSCYRTAEVFHAHGIEFCCGGRIPLGLVCKNKGIDFDDLRVKLERASRKICVSGSLLFEEWSIDFLTDYIVNIHHHYLRKSLPVTKTFLERFVVGHEKKYAHLPELLEIFTELSDETLPHLREEEEIIFPYIRQIFHAYEAKETYAGLLVRTLRKPVENMMHNEHKNVTRILNRMRDLTDGYSLPENACVNHGVTFQKLQEIDADMTQHLYLENDILFPKAISMEKELLQ